MSDNKSGQIGRSAADVYEEFFVPALFGQWPARLLTAGGIQSGDRVLDVACGTGIVARIAETIVGPAGKVAGIDVNDGMLAVAKRKAPKIEWRCGRAEALPFDDDAFDAVASQFGLMFFADRVAALREMRRVVRPGGRIVVAVWDAMKNSPGYCALCDLLLDHLGEIGKQSLEPPFALGDKQALVSVFCDAGLSNVEIMTEHGVARFPSIDSWLYTDVRGWTLADSVSDEQFDRLLEDARVRLRLFTDVQGQVEFAAPAHIAVAIA